MTDEESALSYVFPVLRYHSRWSELTSDDFRYYFGAKPNFFSGYYLRADVKPAQNVPNPTPLTDYAFSDTCWDYLGRMMQLCAENNIQLVLIKAPSLYPFWYDEWDRQITDYAEKYHLPYVNFLNDDKLEATGIDFETDTYDGLSGRLLGRLRRGNACRLVRRVSEGQIRSSGSQSGAGASGRVERYLRQI